ncbi:MAG: hypothetical protein U5K79_08800 [Cyclobacteriaceae bacterium]|nr:hypothetical protein [Cyclobacteriaceae bacterium]
MFAVLIIGIIVSRNKYTILIIGIISINIIVLFGLEYLYPELAVTFDKKRDIVSHGVVFLAVMVIINYLILQLKISYEYEQKKVIEINNDLQSKNEEINYQKLHYSIAKPGIEILFRRAGRKSTRPHGTSFQHEQRPDGA